MNKIIVSLILLLPVASIQSMLVRPLIKKSTQTAQKVVQKRDVYELAVVPALVAGAITTGANFKLLFDLSKVDDKINARCKGSKATRFKEDLVCLNAADYKFMDSTAQLIVANYVYTFAQPDLMWAGVSSYLVLQAALKTSQGFTECQLADAKVDQLIPRKEEYIEVVDLKDVTEVSRSDSDVLKK